VNNYKVRIRRSGISLNDSFEDHFLESEESPAAFVERLSSKGFMDESKRRWILPGSILCIDESTTERRVLLKPT
jgi:hypothetical protein